MQYKRMTMMKVPPGTVVHGIRKRNGLTLLELMVVAGILVVAITALLSSFIHSFILNTANVNKAMAASDAQYVLEKLKNVTYADLASYTDTNFTNLDDEAIAVAVTGSGQSKSVVANVTWTEQGRQRHLELSTLVSW
ncbi:MAG: type II secretion system protein [Candidatus Omnitrophica bacterium]|nr:type II secretion system protein [Candidatus Omnitrophota bacterium]